MSKKTLILGSMMLMMLSITILAGCTKHIEEPWVPNPDYLKSERARSSDLNQELDNRTYYQNDR